MLVVSKKKRESTIFGRRLRELREAAGLTQTELAERAGMVYQVLAKYERGENEPGWPTVLKIAEALGVSVAEFATEGDTAADEPAQPDDEPPTPPAKKPIPKKPKR